MSAKIISLINIKGGVAKTTTTGCLAELIADLKKKILIVDMDPQANISQLLKRYETSKKTINDALILKAKDITKENVNECIQKTDNPLIDIISSNEELSFTCDTITYDTSRAQQIILKKVLNTVKEDYDYIIIDNTPFFNILTINSLSASDYVLTPVGANGFSYAGLTRLLNEIYKIKDEFNENLIFLGAFITNVNKQKVIFKDLYEEYRKELGDKFIEQYIRQDKNVDESNTAFMPLLSYNKDCNAVADYRRLLAAIKILGEKEQEILEKIILAEDLNVQIKDLMNQSTSLEKEIESTKNKIKDAVKEARREVERKNSDPEKVKRQDEKIKQLKESLETKQEKFKSIELYQGAAVKEMLKATEQIDNYKKN